jgi:alkylmercury lyase
MKNDACVDLTVKRLQSRLAAYGPGHLRLLLQVMRELAHGSPLTEASVNHLIAHLGIAPDAAQQFLRELTERDADDQIVGALGLSLSNHPHRLVVEGVALSAWCALDTLFLPALLLQSGTIESPSPVTGSVIQLRVSPTQVEEVSPTNAAISLALVDLADERMSSVEAIWGAFCNHVHYFSTREEGERWASGRDSIAILSVEEGFALGRQLGSVVLDTAA